VGRDGQGRRLSRDGRSRTKPAASCGRDGDLGKLMRSRARNEQGSVITSVLLVPDREYYLSCFRRVDVGGELVVLMRDARGFRSFTRNLELCFGLPSDAVRRVRRRTAITGSSRLSSAI
jgi:hypothetical protein